LSATGSEAPYSSQEVEGRNKYLKDRITEESSDFNLSNSDYENYHIRKSH
jgi:hypothetical protein